MQTMFTPQELHEAEEQIHGWHRQALRPAERPQPQRRPFSGFAARFLAGAGRYVRSEGNHVQNVSDGAISTLGVLDAVARGELSPKAAHRLLHARISTLALLQSVAWGEISPAAARHLLG